MRGEGLPYCLDCNQPIIWVKNPRGYWVPIDPWHSDESNMAITDGDPPTTRYLYGEMKAEEHEWMAICHLKTCRTRERRPSRKRPAGKDRKPVRTGIDVGYTPGLLSGHPGPCAVCCQVTEKLVTDHCHRHGQARDDVCISCNSQLRNADALLRQGDVLEIHASHLAHLRRCGKCAAELDHLMEGTGQEG
jgi:Recombination endonuclease VII